MSSAEVMGPAQVKSNPGHSVNNSKNHVKPANNFKRKNKHERCRKRSKSFSGCGGLINQKPVLPSKFLLGGNIKDPLNLNSLQDEEINRAMNAVTPKSSPVPTPPRKKGQIEVIIPKNIRDPLGLIDGADDAEYEQELCPPPKKPKKKRPKKRRTISCSMEISSTIADLEASEAKTPETSTDSAKIPELPSATDSTATAEVAVAAVAKSAKDLTLDIAVATTKKEKPKRKSEDNQHPLKKFKNNMDKIVSPVVPQPGGWLKRSISVNKPKHRAPKTKEEELQMPVFKDKDKQFQYGNYNRYYGYRNPNNEVDHRLRVFSHHQYMFAQRDILDIGCNIGHITLSIARDFNARSVTGIDIDPKLIAIARKNVQHYVKTTEGESPPRTGREMKAYPGRFHKNKRGKQSMTEKTSTKSSEFFPISMPILYGAIDVPGFSDSHKGKGFPNNVTFKQCNYILEDDNLLALEQPQFDVILCLSVTKWIHLNWGDEGIKQAFRRMYAQLRPGGKLILEPQNWSSYKGKKKLTETIYKNYNSIEFFPEKFREYLLSPAVGFAKSEILGYPPHQSKGFRRPIQVFTKSTMFPSERVEATPQSVTTFVDSYNSSERMKTENYAPQIRIECMEHVYTDLLDSRYCGCTEENADINDKLADELGDEQQNLDGETDDDKKVVRDIGEEESMEVQPITDSECGEGEFSVLLTEGKTDAEPRHEVPKMILGEEETIDGVLKLCTTTKDNLDELALGSCITHKNTEVVKDKEVIKVQPDNSTLSKDNT